MCLLLGQVRFQGLPPRSQLRGMYTEVPQNDPTIVPSQIKGSHQLLPQGPTGYLGEGPSWGQAPASALPLSPVPPFSAYIHPL